MISELKMIVELIIEFIFQAQMLQYHIISCECLLLFCAI